MWIGPQAVLVPVKAFHEAKLRLAPALQPERRAALAREMASRVVASAAGLPVAVVCDDPGVASWARERGALVIWEPGRGLNGAVEEGVRHLHAAGAQMVIVTASDLPLASDLRGIAQEGAVTIVADRRGDGTNVIALPPGCGFRFAYGPGSFARHRDEARRVGLAVVVLESPTLAWDVDIPEDLAGLPN
jgi:2-phospho-L-lactate guanylyltransferase